MRKSGKSPEIYNSWITDGSFKLFYRVFSTVFACETTMGRHLGFIAANIRYIE